MKAGRPLSIATLTVCLFLSPALLTASAQASALPVSPGLPVHAATAQEAAAAKKLLADTPLLFERNEGQYGSGFDFVSRAFGHTFLIHPSGAIVRLPNEADPQHPSEVGMTFLGSRGDAVASPSKPAATVVNYYRGRDRSKWRSGVKSFAGVRYIGVYDGIDVEYYGRGGALEYDFLVHPGADPRQISLSFDGARATCIDPDGALVVETAAGELRHLLPSIYQRRDDGSRQTVKGSFVLDGGQVSIALGEYDSSRELVIDPQFVWTYNVITGNVTMVGVGMDSAGNVVLAGTATGYDVVPVNGISFATRYSPALDPDTDAFIFKVNATTRQVVHCSYLGGVLDEELRGLAVDAAGNAYIAGVTESDDFPTTLGAYQTSRLTTYVTAVPFVAKFDTTGALSWATFVSGEYQDTVAAIVVDSAGCPYITGNTLSAAFPTTVDAGSQIVSPIYAKAYVTKLAADGGAIVYSTRIGGRNGTSGTALTVDSSGSAFVAGTSGVGLPTTANVFQPTSPAGAGDGFVSRLSPTGTVLFTSYLTGSVYASGITTPYGIAVDSSGDVYIAGYTEARDFPVTSDAMQSTGDKTGFYMRIDSTASTIKYATFLPGAALALSIDHLNRVVILCIDSSSSPGGLPYYVTVVRRLMRFGISNALESSTGITGDVVRALPVDSSNRVCVVNFRNGHVWIRKLDWTGSQLVALGNVTPVTRTRSTPSSYAEGVYTDVGYFPNGTTMTVGGVQATFFQMCGGTYPTCSEWYMPTVPPGSHDITITTPGGDTSLLQGNYEYLDEDLRIDSVTPNTFDASARQVITINGTGFGRQDVFSATSQGTNPTYYVLKGHRVDAHTYRALMPPSARVGTYDVRVFANIPNIDYVKTAAFTVTGVPMGIASHPVGPTTGGTTLNLYAFADPNPITGIDFGGVPATTFVAGSQLVTATSPAHAAGRVDLTVHATSGNITLPSAFRYYQDVTAAGVSPTAGPAAGNTLLTITGTGFVLGARVSVGGVLAAVQSVSSTQITALTPAHWPGLVSVAVRNPDGGAAAVANAFTFSGPYVTDVDPVNGSISGGTVVTIVAPGVIANPTVYFDSIQATSVSVNGNNITATTPAHVLGPVDVTVTNSDGETGTLPRSFMYLAGTPTITSVTPSSGPLSGGTSITIQGTNFHSRARVQVGWYLLQNAVISSTSITGVTPPGQTDGSGGVRVTNPDGQFATGTFTYMAAPVLTNFNPKSGPATGGTTVTLTGSVFRSGMRVFFGTAESTTVSITSATSATAVTPAHAVGDVSVSVQNTDGQSSVHATPYRFMPGTPTITSFTPTRDFVGATVTINGTNFEQVTAVKFNNVTATYTVVNATQITATVPAGATTGPITVTNWTATATSASNFNVETPGPRIDSFNPTTGPVGTTVTLTGARFTGTTSVAFGGVSAGVPSIASDTQMTAVVPTGALTGPISATSAQGTGTSVGTFSVPPRFAATPFSPASGTPGTSVTISGANFQGTTQVTFNGAPATFTIAGDGNSISATVPANATTGPVTVVTPLGTITTGTSFLVPAVISDFNPKSGGAGTSIVITGQRFTGATAVTVGGFAATSFTIDSATQITAVVSANGGTGSVAVTTPGGTATSAATFTFSGPTITGFTPNKFSTNPQTVTITGTNLVNVTAVTFGGVAIAPADWSVTGTTQITVTLRANPQSGRIGVTVNGTTIYSADLFYGIPSISGFTPTSGAPGDIVTIAGNNFLGTNGPNAVGFGPGNAIVYSRLINVVSNTQIQAQVPGFAQTGPVVVNTPYGFSVTSSSSFTITTQPNPVLSVRRLPGTAAIALSWTGALQLYDIHRSTSATGGFVPVATGVMANWALDVSATPGQVYFYKIFRQGTTHWSNVDFGVAYAFTDDPLVAGSTSIKAIHLIEIRNAVNLMRAAINKSQIVWTDSSPASVPVRAAHINELRSAVIDFWSAYGQPVPFTDPGTLSAGGPIKAVHFQELRNAVK